MRKKVDERIRTLIENGVKARHRSMFVIIGDKPHDQIMNLHHIMSKSVVKARPNLLWCYKEELDFSSHQKKRAMQIKKLTQRGLLDPERADPFSLFLQSTTITYCYYRDSERILGNTFGMCILQDFEALTPNLLARTIETVEGGGLVILLLRSLSSLTSMYTMVMDVHARFRTESHSLVSGRFNERFMLSLASCKSCIVMDDELNILPISSHMRAITPAPVREDAEGLSESERELKNLKEELNGVFPGGPLIRKCFTMGQGEAVITFLDAISAKNPQSIVALLASRGRGKSAALGLAIAGAVAVGYSNIFVTAPSPENLKTVFEFVRKGLDMLDYKVILDYDVVESTNPDFNKTTVQINVFKHHKQIIQYIQPHEHGKLLQAQLLVIDEAAAIPLSIVKSLLGPYVVFLSSTVNGYEGTGRSLSLKLLQQLEEKYQTPSKRTMNSVSDRLFKKIELSESIRYASADPIESWLNSLLCLDVINSVPSISRLPDAGECSLYYVNKDTLFSYNRDSELFLKRMMALFVASHYKNSPNDLQLIADAPAHHLFVLLGPVDESINHLPDILCVIQICFEGQISRKSAMKSLAGGHQPSGDQIAWKFCEQFRDTVFPSLSGARIVRIATHPSAMRHGYGSAAVKILSRYFAGQLFPTSEFDFEEIPENSQVSVAESVIAAAEKACLLDENIKPRTDLPPLLAPLRERQPEKLHYLGVSFGLTLDLFRFWRKIDFVPFYIGHIPSKVTGEHTCMVLKPLNNDNIESSESDRFGFLSPFYQEFRNRFRENLAQDFNQMEYKLSMCILEPKLKFSEIDPTLLNPSESLNFLRGTQSLSMELLAAYTDNLVYYHMTKHLVRPLARAYFCEKIPVTLSHSQASVLLCMGLQLKKIPDIEEEMNLQRQTLLSLYMEVMKEFYKYLRIIATNETQSTVSCLKDVSTETHPVSVDGDLHNAAKQDKDKMQANSDGFIRTCRSQQQKNQKADRKNEKKRSEYGSDSKTNKRRRP